VTKPKTKTVNDFSRCLDPLDMDATLIAVIEMSQSSWLVAGIVPGVERQPLKKLAIDEDALLSLLNRWRAEAEKNGHPITRIAVAFEAGHDGFWLARWLAAQGGPRHSCIERCGNARTSSGEDRSARHGASQARFSRLAAR
jgi:transposase